MNSAVKKGISTFIFCVVLLLPFLYTKRDEMLNRFLGYLRMPYQLSQMIDFNSVNAYASDTTVNHLHDPQKVLAPFWHKLRALELDNQSRLVRMFFVSTSGNGFDRLSSQMRYNFQPIFGDGGKGLISATKGWKYHRHQDVRWKHSKNWDTYAVTFGRYPNGHYGVAGVHAINKGEAWINLMPPNKKKKNQFTVGRNYQNFTLFYQETPGGGQVKLLADQGKVKKVINMRGKGADKKFELTLPKGPHAIYLQTDSRKNHLYALALENNSGVIVDAAMMVGLSVSQLHNYSQTHLNRQFAMRPVDLLMFQLGENEAYFNPNKKQIDKFVTDYLKAVKSYKEASDAPCLLISIKDMGKRVNGEIVTRPGVTNIVKASQKVAQKAGCAFFNLFEAMGGEGAIGRWRSVRPRLVAKDLGHLFGIGARKVGDIISKGILQNYREKFPKR